MGRIFLFFLFNSAFGSSSILREQFEDVELKISLKSFRLSKKAARHAELKNHHDSIVFFADQSQQTRNNFKNSRNRILNKEIKQLINELNQLESERSSLLGELKTQGLLEMRVGNDSLSKKNLPKFKCKNFLETEGSQLSVHRKFGEKFEISPNVSIESKGWWLEHNGNSYIQLCDSGIVEFFGLVPDRGNVLLVKHNEFTFSLYTHIAISQNFQKGQKIDRKNLIRLASNRFYFEIKQGAESINPGSVFEESKSFLNSQN